MLSTEEQRIWDDVQRFWAEEAQEPPRAARSRGTASARSRADLPLSVIIGSRITIVLIFLGAMTAALVAGVATALAWGFWHRWPTAGGGRPTSAPAGGGDR